MSMLTPRGLGGAKRRRRRNIARRLLAVVIVLAVLAGIGYGVWYFYVRDQGSTTTATSCLTPSPKASKTAKPKVTAVSPRRVGVNVYNATARQGLASSVATQLAARGFVVRKVANDPLKKVVTAPAEIRHGPKGGPYAVTVAAQVEGAVQVLDRRPNASVDLVLGSGYQALRAPASAAAILNPAPTPVPTTSQCR